MTDRPESTDTWMNPDIIPFTKEHERMLREVHELVTAAAKQVEAIAPQLANLAPMLGAFGIEV